MIHGSRKFYLALSLTLAVAPVQVSAEEQVNTEEIHVLDSVVVTSNSKSKLVDTPASISIITAKDLEEMGAKQVIDALERIPGVDNTSSSSSSISIRGNRSSMAGGPVIMVDGVRQSYGDSQREQLDIIPISNIEKIEVLRSAGINGGPGAARGVINIITKKADEDEPLHGQMSAVYGSWNTANLNAVLNGAVDKWDYLVNGSFYSTDGYEDEAETRYNGQAKLGYHLSEDNRIGFEGSWVNLDKDFAYDIRKYKWQLENYRRDSHFPISSTSSEQIWNNNEDQTNGLYALTFNHDGSKLDLNALLSYDHYEEDYHDNWDTHSSTSSTRGNYDDRDQDSFTGSFSGSYTVESDSMMYKPSLGIDLEYVDFSQRRYYPYDTSEKIAGGSSNIDMDQNIFGIYQDNDFLFNDKWGLQVGNRIDYVNVSFDTMEPSSFDTDEVMWSWSVAPSWHFVPDASVYVSVGQNYWFPSPRYYYWAADYGSPENSPDDLEPEKNLTWELGYKQRMSRAFNISVTTFYMTTDDKFTSFYENGSYMGQKNTGDSEAYGIEVELDGRPLDWLGWRLSGNLMKTEWNSGTARVYSHPDNVKEVVELDGYQVYGIPEVTGTAGVDFFPLQGLQLSVDANYTGEYYLDYTNRLKYPAKTTFDSRVSYAWDRYKVWLLGKNVFDEEMEHAYNSDAELTEPGGEPMTVYYVQDGAYVEVGFSIDF